MALPGNKIQVFTRCPVTRIILDKPLEIQTLCFWHSNNLLHSVNAFTVELFLKHAFLYGAYVHPNQPNKGCCSLNADQQLSSEQVSVAQIYYQGQLIYNR